MSALELVKAVFRLAFCDYVGKAYGHDEPGPNKHARINPTLQSDAAKFLEGPWASHLGDLAGFPVSKVWKQAQRDLLHHPASALLSNGRVRAQGVATLPTGRWHLDPGGRTCRMISFGMARGRSPAPVAGVERSTLLRVPSRRRLGSGGGVQPVSNDRKLTLRWARMSTRYANANSQTMSLSPSLGGISRLSQP